MEEDDVEEDDVLDVPDLSDSEISPSSVKARRLRELRPPFGRRLLASDSFLGVALLRVTLLAPSWPDEEDEVEEEDEEDG